MNSPFVVLGFGFLACIAASFFVTYLGYLLQDATDRRFERSFRKAVEAAGLLSPQEVNEVCEHHRIRRKRMF